MSDIAIKVENLGKKYIIGHQKEGDLRSSFGSKIKNLFGPSQGQTHEEFWALKDISFEIKKGEAVGIIGRNGAGKSTLLKILSRITDPSTGRFEMNGRVSSLLEVGTGFHPELSGRENIYLNGTILGMKRREIKEKFDEIVAFSGVEKFIDTPVKHYSSGMKVRLAFSVAAHLEPEILIVDEVLAVGDAEFQKKCLGKMDEVSRNEGRTVIFVSHNMGAIETLCEKVLLLSKGTLDYLGDTSDTISLYIKNSNFHLAGTKWEKVTREKDIPLEIVTASLSINGKQPNLTLTVSTTLISNANHLPALIAYDVAADDDMPIVQAIPSENPFITYSESENFVETAINLQGLVPGNYKLSIWVGSHYTETFDWRKEVLTFSINQSPMIGRTHPHSKRNGYFVPKSQLLNS